MTESAQESGTSLQCESTDAVPSTVDLLLFSLGGPEVFGINVFKVREVTRAPRVTPTPNFRPGVQGVISLRGHIIPVLDLASFSGLSAQSGNTRSTLMVTQFNGTTQGFLVHSVDHIVHIQWDQIKAPTLLCANNKGNLVTGITELDNGTLVSILDLEHILVEAFGSPEVPPLEPLPLRIKGSVMLIDDSSVARERISEVLEHLEVPYQLAVNGREAWEKLDALATRCAASQQPLLEQISLILTDVEMPEMDGYTLTKLVKADSRFAGIPIIMHSSLSTQTNRELARRAGADDYVEKFEPQGLAATLRSHLDESKR